MLISINVFYINWPTSSILVHFTKTWCLCYRALHWVTIEMLCVPVEEEIPEVADSVVKAITGEQWDYYY